MLLPAGSLVGSYEILAPLGSGGMGEVYKGRDTLLGREAAIKTILSGRAGNDERKSRFRRLFVGRCAGGHGSRARPPA